MTHPGNNYADHELLGYGLDAGADAVDKLADQLAKVDQWSVTIAELRQYAAMLRREAEVATAAAPELAPSHLRLIKKDAGE